MNKIQVELKLSSGYLESGGAVEIRSLWQIAVMADVTEIKVTFPVNEFCLQKIIVFCAVWPV